MEVYTRYINDEQYEVLFSLKDLYNLFLRSIHPRDIHKTKFDLGFRHEEFEGRSLVIYAGSIFNKNEVSEEEIKEIERLVDKEIKDAEESLKKMGGVAVSGWHFPVREDRDKYIEQRVLVKRFTPKTFEELNQSLFHFKTLNK